MIDLLHKLNTCYSRWPLRIRINDACPPSFEYFHPFVNYPMAHTVISTESCHSFKNFTSFHTFWPQKSDHRLLFIFDSFCQWSRHVKSDILNYYHNGKDSENQDRRFTLLLSSFTVPHERRQDEFLSKRKRCRWERCRILFSTTYHYSCPCYWFTSNFVRIL
jgi:hypothetical protein